MDPGEGQQAKEGKTNEEGGSKNTVDESGKWTAYGIDGDEIGHGILLNVFPIEGKLPDSMGSYRFKRDIGALRIKRLVIEATQRGGEDKRLPHVSLGYADRPLNDSGNTENNYEFHIMSILFVK